MMQSVPYELNKGFSSKFFEVYCLGQALEESQKVRQWKCYYYDNKEDNDNSPNTSMNNNDNSKSQKFSKTKSYLR